MRIELPELSNPRAASGLSVVSLLISVAILGVLAGLGIWALSESRNAVSTLKLQSNVDTINYSISAFRASGGSLERIDDTQEILETLKRHQSKPANLKFFAGSPELMIDSRLAVRRMSAKEAAGDGPRAFWVAEKQKFVVATSGHGVKEFFIEAQ